MGYDMTEGLLAVILSSVYINLMKLGIYIFWLRDS